MKTYNLVVMGDNAGENRLSEIFEFLNSKGLTNHFSTAHEQWQHGLAEAAITLIMRLARTPTYSDG